MLHLIMNEKKMLKYIFCVKIISQKNKYKNKMKLLLPVEVIDAYTKDTRIT